MTTMLALRPLSARSVVLSLLLGAHPAELSAAALVRAGELFDVPETTLRAAVSRMVSAGDLVRDGSTYTLSERLLNRQRRQDDSLRSDQVDWDGTWEQVVITSSGRSALTAPSSARRWPRFGWPSSARASGCGPPTWPAPCPRGRPT